MVRFFKKQVNNSRGYTLIEIMLVLVIIAILGGIIVARYAEASAQANTGKIAADLRSLDSMIVAYQAAHSGAALSNLGDLVTDGLIQVVPNPPSGKVFINAGAATAITDTSYSIDTANNRAMLGSNVAEDFHYQ